MTIRNKVTSAISLATVLFSTTLGSVHAAITNPAVGDLGNDTEGATNGSLFVGYFLVLWNAAISIGALAVLVYFLWGAFEWITSAGDSGKIEGARNKMLHAFIGLLLLISAYTIIGFLSTVFFGKNFNILIPTFFTPGNENAPTGGSS